MNPAAMIRGSDVGYPPQLRDLEEVPDLYVLGQLAANLPHVGVVGTRNCTRYGIEIAEAIGVVIAAQGWVTVSGLARGIDTAVHRGTISAGGLGVGVLGSGIGRIYPKENQRIADGLLGNGGAIVSEYPGTTPPEAWRFPRRNRIIAAVSHAVVVVESRMTGGSQITAVLAAELGRPVFAIPGDIDRETSVGTNLLIRDGAIPALGPEDLISSLSLLSAFPAQSRFPNESE